MTMQATNRVLPVEAVAAVGEEGPEEEEEQQQPLQDPWLNAVGVKATSEASRRVKGLPHPPQKVSALAEDEVAWVWWQAPPEPDEDDKKRDAKFVQPYDITSYIVKRYRRNVNTMEFDYKGSTDVGLCYQATIEGLQNGQYYSFSVVAVSKRGLGLESSRSETVKPDTPLPKGWEEHWDPKTKRSFYKNVATLQVTWDRPQRLNTALGMDLYLRFRREEHAAMEQFFEKASNHGRVQVFLPSVLSFLQSVGIRGLERSEVAEMVGKALVANDVTALPFSTFVLALLRVKDALRLRTFFCKSCGKRAAMAPPRIDRMEKDDAYTTFTPVKDWVRYRHQGALFYFNKQTKETTYTMPEEIRYHLPADLQQRLLGAYSISEVKRFEAQYALMDIDGDGAVTEEELTLLLKSLGQRPELKQVQAMLSEYTGKRWRLGLTFPDYCEMLHAVARKNASGAWVALHSRLGAGPAPADWPPPMNAFDHPDKICFCGCKLDSLAKAVV